MNSDELTTWDAFALIEPFALRPELLAEAHLELFANANRDTKKHRRPFRRADLIRTPFERLYGKHALEDAANDDDEEG